MLNPIKKYHLITNFPPNYPFYKKVFANLIYFLTGIIIHPRKNLLTHGDLIKARFIMRKGDVALWGNLREVSSLFISGPLTHASLYAGNKKFIEAVGDGVRTSSLHHMFTEYDTLAVLRLPKKTPQRRKKIKEALKYAEEQIGKPYDFDFSPGSGKLFCTELVNYAYRKAKHDTKLKTMGPFAKGERRIIQRIITATRALHPIKMAEEGNFDILFMSHNLRRKSSIYLK